MSNTYIPVFLFLVDSVVSNSEVEVSDAVDELGPDRPVLAEHEAVP